MDNIKERTSLPMPELLTRVSCRKDWKRISAESSLMPLPSPPPDDLIGRGSEVNGCSGEGEAAAQAAFSPNIG